MATNSDAVYIGKICTWNPDRGFGVVECIDIDAPYLRVPIPKETMIDFASALQEQGGQTKIIGLRVSFEVRLNDHGGPHAEVLRRAPWEVLDLPVVGLDACEVCHVTISSLSTTVLELKKMIEDAAGIPSITQALSLDTATLYDHYHLSNYDCLLRRASQLSLTRLDVVSPEIEKFENRDIDVRDRIEALEELARLLDEGVLDENKFCIVLGRSLQEDESVELRSEIICKLGYPIKGGSATIESLKHAALLDTDEDIRGRAANALADAGDKLAIPALEDILRSGQGGYAVCNAIKGLQSLDEAKALDLCTILALEDVDDDVRESAVQALSSIGDKRAIPTLLEVLNRDASPFVVAQAALALGNIGDEAVVPQMICIFQTILPEASPLRPETVPESAYAIVQALGALGDERAVPQLETVLQDLGLYEQSFYIHVARALGKLGHKSGGRALLWVLQLPESMGTFNMASAAEALGELGDEGAIPELQKLLEVEDHAEFSFHVQAAHALAKLGDASGLGVLMQILMGQSVDRSIEAVEALGSIGTPEARKALQKASECHTEEVVQERSLEQLESLAS